MSGAIVQENVGAGAVLSAPSTETRRRPLKEVQVLLPVWGSRFVNQFLDFMLPTLLAPGNLPAVADMIPCRFVLMTSRADLPTIRTHPGWRQLTRICNVEVRSIDDLITERNHTATITLAFARVVREAGDAMPDTCFVFLVSDYLVADGSLRTVVERVLAGASGVLAGNFQVIAEKAIPLLRYRIDVDSPYLSLAPRELMTWALTHLHPSTIANIVTFKFSHSVHTNRLFWRVDANTLIGRFYLMHPIGIRPEVTDFIIGSSFDYSFIPEMCPSNNVVTLTDSDHYLVVELQPGAHEAENLRRGPAEVKELADTLSEWTTARHRENVHETLIFHADNVPADIDDAVAKADAFIDQVHRLLSLEPKSHRHHYYWVGSMAVHRAATGRPMSREHWKFILDKSDEQRDRLTALMQRLRNIIFGWPPDVTCIHSRWLDYRLPIEYLQKTVPSGGRILLVAGRPRGAGRWAVHSVYDAVTLDANGLLALQRRDYLPLVGSFDICLLVMFEEELEQCNDLIERIGPLLRCGGSLMIVLLKSHRRTDEAYYVGRFANFATWITEIQYVRSSRTRWLLNKVMRGNPPQPFDLPSSIERGVLLAIGGYLSNLFSQEAALTTPPERLCSSVFIIMRPPPTASTRLPSFRFCNDIMLRSNLNVVSHNSRYLELLEEFGREPFGLTADQLWHDNPGCLPIVLARYGFVANLLAGRHDVAELSCADAFGARIVLQDVKKVTAYLSNSIFVGDIDRRRRQDWPLEIRQHDILRGPLPTPHDSIYSLDMVDYIPHEDEDTFIRNLRDSLTGEEDILIIGSSTLTEAGMSFGVKILSDAEADASPRTLSSAATVTAAGASSGKDDPQIVRRTAANLRSLLEHYFRVVFIFSMVDETIRAGASPAADYTFAVCSYRKAKKA